MKKFNSKSLICLTISMVCASCSCLFVDAETTQSITPKEGKIQASFTNILRRIGTTKATIIKEFELPSERVTADDIYNAESIGIKNTNTQEKVLNTGCFKDSDGNYTASAFHLKVESVDKRDGTPKELKMVAKQDDPIDGEHFKVTSCKTEETTNADTKPVLKITWEIEGYDLEYCTEIVLPKFWATQNSTNSDKAE